MKERIFRLSIRKGIAYVIVSNTVLGERNYNLNRKHHHLLCFLYILYRHIEIVMLLQ